MSMQHTYSDLPERVEQSIAAHTAGFASAGAIADSWPEIAAARPNTDGELEELGSGLQVTHRFVEAPGDSETVRWHLVESGDTHAPVVVFLHGVPDSWWQWHYAIEALSGRFRCVAVDLKGYGQSDKRTGDYRQAGVAAQLEALLDVLGIGEFSLVTHDRGVPPADYLVAGAGERVRAYVRGQQHLWHLNPKLHPQEAMFLSPEAPALLGDARRFVATAYGWLSARPVAQSDLLRTVAEFSYPGIASAVPRYFHSSSFRQEWVDRRARLIGAWRSPVLILQGADDPMQPREYYLDREVSRRLPAGSDVELLDAGHFWPFEAPKESVQVIETFLKETG
jgi:pimeloyl-ACP methyl ester carboxylesterase